MHTERPQLSLKDGGTLRDFISRIEQGIYIVTPAGEIVDANPALLAIFGAKSLEELRPYRSEDLVVDPMVLIERRRLLTEHGWIRDYRYEIRCLDGTVRRVRDTVFTQRDDAGNVEALHGIMDVVDDEDRNDRHDNPLSAFFTGAPAGLAILDEELRFTRINHRLAEMHLLPVEDHLGRPLAEVLPGLKPIVEPILRQVLLRGVPAVNIELATEDPYTPQEARAWRFSAFPVGPVEESPTGVGIVVVDITDAKRMEQEARLDGRYLAALIESSPLAMVTLDPHGRVVWINAAFESLFLLSPGDLLGTDLDEALNGPAQQDEARQLTGRAQQGERLRADVYRRRRDGTTIRVRLNAAPITLDGEQIGAQFIYEQLDP